MSSNPLKTALSRAAGDLAGECTAAGITFDFAQRKIFWRGVEKYIPPGSTRREVRATLKKMINADKEVRRKDSQVALV